MLSRKLVKEKLVKKSVIFKTCPRCGGTGTIISLVNQKNKKPIKESELRLLARLLLRGYSLYGTNTDNDKISIKKLKYFLNK